MSADRIIFGCRSCDIEIVIGVYNTHHNVGEVICDCDNRMRFVGFENGN